VKPIVVDASIAVKWVIAETYSEPAARLLTGTALHAPAHWLAEATNVLWAKAHWGDLTGPQALSRTTALREAPIRPAPLADLILPALEISLALAITEYDSLYIALAQALGGIFVTADERLVRKCVPSVIQPDLVIWIGEPRYPEMIAGTRRVIDTS